MISRIKTSTIQKSISPLPPYIEVCGDCDASEPAWASLNRGVLLCSDCCSVHRSLGRHISIVKSLRQGYWPPTQLNYIKTISQTANNIWEYTLIEPIIFSNLTGTPKSQIKTAKIKPSPKDSLHPNKSEFIKAKYCNLQYILRPKRHHYDDIPNNEIELSKQLHASVRSANLETTFRLLVQGADPNFYHEEKRSTPLHIAAKFGQALQVELLVIYGAHINCVDGNGETPVEIAQNNDYIPIAERLIEAMYEVTDRIIVFLGNKKPDHLAGKHLYIPERRQNTEITEQLKIARGRLQLVPNKMFEELVMDIYDEVDRRENEAIWMTSPTSLVKNPDNGVIPFLPVNPFLSATRNQGRQKLARFSPNEFFGLLTDILIDAKRRQNMASLRPINSCSSSPLLTVRRNMNNGIKSTTSDDEPLYDDVADEDNVSCGGGGSLI